jgi:hypothetical protein
MPEALGRRCLSTNVIHESQSVMVLSAGMFDPAAICLLGQYG